MTLELKPNLFIVGAMKCGTSSLHSYLGSHPEIFMCAPKEPSHFVDRATLREIWPEMANRGYWKRENYLTLFQGAGDVPIRGESSTNYSKLPLVRDVPRRIADFNPDARFIYVMRDPVHRTISHYWHNARSQRERRDMLTAIREDPQYVEVSDYAMQLRAYTEVFGAERIKTVVTEEMLADPIGTVQDVFRWLGVNATFVPPNLDERIGATPAVFERAQTLPAIRRFHRSQVWHKLSPLVPRALRRATRQGLYRREKVAIADAPEEQVVMYLQQVLQPRTERLACLLGRDFPMWTLLYANLGTGAGNCASDTERPVLGSD
jgi:Sulfotransferase family